MDIIEKNLSWAIKITRLMIKRGFFVALNTSSISLSLFISKLADKECTKYVNLYIYVQEDLKDIKEKKEKFKKEFLEVFNENFD